MKLFTFVLVYQILINLLENKPCPNLVFVIAKIQSTIYN